MPHPPREEIGKEGGGRVAPGEPPVPNQCQIAGCERPERPRTDRPFGFCDEHWWQYFGTQRKEMQESEERLRREIEGLARRGDQWRKETEENQAELKRARQQAEELQQRLDAALAAPPAQSLGEVRRIAYTNSEDGSSVISSKLGRRTVGLGPAAIDVLTDALQRTNTSNWGRFLSLDHPGMVQSFVANHHDGIDVRLLIDRSQAGKTGTRKAIEAFIEAGVPHHLCEGALVKWSQEAEDYVAAEGETELVMGVVPFEGCFPRLKETP